MVVGMPLYASLAAHLPTKTYLKKDDLESALFLLSYLIHKKSAFWTSLTQMKPTKRKGYGDLMKAKYEANGNQLFPGHKYKFLANIFQYIREGSENPDYEIIKGEMMILLAEKSGQFIDLQGEIQSFTDELIESK